MDELLQTSYLLYINMAQSYVEDPELTDNED